MTYLIFLYTLNGDEKTLRHRKYYCKLGVIIWILETSCFTFCHQWWRNSTFSCIIWYWTHYRDVTWAWWRLKSQATQLFFLTDCSGAQQKRQRTVLYRETIQRQAVSPDKEPVMWKVFPWVSYQIRKIAGCACAGNAGKVFPRSHFQRKP